jgi:site-specific DNA recombinase
MTATVKTHTAREYLRVSDDRSGRARSTDEQHHDNADAADENGWQLGEPYRDNDRSASRYATKAREGYDQLVTDLESDRFGADVLILWEGSRGSRKVSEWVILLELLEARGVLVHITSHDRLYDPSRPRDRKSLLEDSVDSEYESGKTSLRGRRAAAAHAAAGQPTGRIPFGYTRRYEFHTVNGKQVRTIHQEPDPATAPLVRELFDRVKAGHSLRSIERDWAARGIVNASGRPFTAQHLRSLLLTRAYIGERVHNPGGKSGNGARTITPTTLVVPGTWDGLVDRSTFLAVQRILAAPERRTNRPGRGVHLLSMIAKCAVCDGPLSVAFRKPGGQYTCQKASHVRVDKVELDDLAELAILTYLDGEDVHDASAAADDDSAALATAREEVENIRGELDDLVAQLSSGALSATLAARAEPGILARLRAAEEREKELSTPSQLRRLMPPGTDWETMPMSAKREVARIVLTPQMLGELRIIRRPRDAGPRRVPVAQRVEWSRA